MRRYFTCLLSVLLLLAALALPVLAEPDETVFDEPVTAVESAPGGEEETFATQELDETDPDEGHTFIAIMPYGLATEPESTIGFVPIDAELGLLAGEDEGLLSQRNLTWAALGFSALALLLGIVALARTRKKTSPNATGNYQKYF